MSGILKKTQEHVVNLFKTEIPADLKYHNLEHTKEVVKTAEEIGLASGLSKDELEMLLIAAWFHDSGFAEVYDGHEAVSIKISSQFLRINNYPEEKIERINSIIAATKVGSRPENLLEMIIKDADLSHAGKKKFYIISAGLRSEWLKYRGKTYSDSEWLKINADFLNSTRFYTPYARDAFSKQKEANLNELEKLLVE